MMLRTKSGAADKHTGSLSPIRRRPQVTSPVPTAPTRAASNEDISTIFKVQQPHVQEKLSSHVGRIKNDSPRRRSRPGTANLPGIDVGVSALEEPMGRSSRTGSSSSTEHIEHAWIDKDADWELDSDRARETQKEAELAEVSGLVSSPNLHIQSVPSPQLRPGKWLGNRKDDPESNSTSSARVGRNRSPDRVTVSPLVASSPHRHKLTRLQSRANLKDHHSSLHAQDLEQDIDLENPSLESFPELHEQLKKAVSTVGALQQRLETELRSSAELSKKLSELELVLNEKDIKLENLQQNLEDREREANEMRRKLGLATDHIAKTIAFQNKDFERLQSETSSSQHVIKKLTSQRDDLMDKLAMKEEQLAKLREEFLGSMKGHSVGVQTIGTTKGYHGLWYLTALRFIAEIGMNKESVDAMVQTDQVSEIQRVERDSSKKVLIDKSTTTDPSESAAPEKTHSSVAETEVVSEPAKWWKGCLRVSEIKFKNYQKDPSMHMTSNQLLAIINDVYSEKAATDVCADRSLMNRQSLPEFLLQYLLLEYDDRDSADNMLSRILVNVRWYSADRTKNENDKGQPGHAHKEEEEHKDSTYDLHCKKFQHRVVLFARFLGIRAGDQDPIPLNGLNIFLLALVKGRKGEAPLLGPSHPLVQVNVDHMVGVMDWIFGQCRSIVREKVKTTVIDLSKKTDLVDVEAAALVAIEEWLDLYEKRDHRLRALFSNADSHGAGIMPLKQFCSTLRKMGDEIDIKTWLKQISMYTQLCMWPTVSMSRVIKVASESGLDQFRVGPVNSRQKISDEQHKTFGTIANLYKAASDIMEESFQHFDDTALSKGLHIKWHVVEDMLDEGREAEMLFMMYNLYSKAFSRTIKEVKGREKEAAEKRRLAEQAAAERAGKQNAMRPARTASTERPGRTPSTERVGGYGSPLGRPGAIGTIGFGSPVPRTASAMPRGTSPGRVASSVGGPSAARLRAPSQP